jgi:Ca2+-binding RTX toxin-like protein
MNGAAGDDEITGGSGADTITGGEGQDTVNGGGGDDTIVLGTQAADGTDDIIGGSGVDTISIAAGQSFGFSTADSKLQGVEAVSLGAGASVTLTGQTEGFNVIGGGGAETIITSSGDDTVSAGLGDDFIQAAAGADVINGGAGSDTVSYADVTGATSHGEAAVTGMAVNFAGESVADADITANVLGLTTVAGIATGNLDPNNLLASGTVQYLSAAKGATVDDYAVDTLTSVEGFTGSALNDYIVLGADAVTVNAGAGADLIFSGTAADNINAGAGDDFVLVGASSDHGAAETVEGGAGDDTIVFTSVLGETLVLSANVTGVETVQITDSAGVATGTTAESIDASALTVGIALVGNDGANTLTGSAFADTFVAGAGDDRLVVDDLDTAVDGGAGTDTIVVAADTAFGLLAADGVTEQLTNVEAAELASGVTLTVDNSDVVAAGTITAVTGVNDAATETLVVTGAAIGGSATLDFSGGAIDLTNVVLNYQGGAGIDKVTGADLTGDILSGGLGNDELTVVLNGGEDTLTGGDGNDKFTVSAADSTRDIVVVTDYEVFASVGTATVDTLDVVDTTVATLSGVVGVDTRTDLGAGAVVTRTDGETIESFEVSATGLVTLYNSNLAVGTVDEVYAQSDADIYAIMEALTLLSAGATTYTFEYDFNTDGTPDGQIVISDDAGGITNIVQLVGVTGAELNAAADGIVIA